MTMYRGSKSFGGEKKREKNLLQKAVLTFLMTGVVAWPSFSPVYAEGTAPVNNNIVRSDGGTNVVTQRTGTQGGLVTDIYVGKQHGAVGVNVFSKFDVPQNDIANMQFHSQDKSYTATHLLNFVNDRINIHGTVNAIRNNKIGGNLYFISSNGMLVGKTGAINAGALTVIAPQQSYISGAFGTGDNDATDAADKVLKGMIQGNIPLNKDGSIVVNGTIRTALETRLMSANIAVGKEVDDQGKLTGADTATPAKILTGVDFSSVVNTQGLEGFEYALPGDIDSKKLTLKEETKQDGTKVYYVLDEAQGMRSDGAINLEAKLSINDYNVDGMLKGGEQTFAEVLGKVNLKTDIEVGANVVLDSVGNTNIAADSNASPAGVTNNFQLAITGAEADVAVNGTINAGGAVNITANATSMQMRMQSVFSKVNRVIEKLRYIINGKILESAELAVVEELCKELKPFFENNKVMALDITNKTNIAVGRGAHVTANGGDVKVQAASVVVASADMKVNPVEPSVTTENENTYKDHPFENIALALSIVENMSDVDVEGELCSRGGNVTEVAYAKGSSSTKPTITSNKHDKNGQIYSSYANAAVGVDLVNNHATAIVGEAATLTSSSGAVIVQSQSDADVKNGAKVGTDQRSAVNTAIGYVNLDAGARTRVDGAINGAVVSIGADATVSGNSNSSENSSKDATVTINGQQTDTEWKTLANFQTDPEEQKKNASVLSKFLKVLGYGSGNGDTIFDKFDVGAAIAISELDNKGEVEIGNGTNITASAPDITGTDGSVTKALTISSNAVVKKVKLGASSDTTDSDKRDTNKVGVNIGVAVEDIDNLASLVIEADDEAAGQQEPVYSISAPNGSVVISANTSVGNFAPVSWFEGIKSTILSVPTELENVKNFLDDVLTRNQRTLEEYQSVFGIDAQGNSNLKNANNGDASLYAEDAWQKLQTVEANTNGGLSAMLNDLTGLEEAYERDLAALKQSSATDTGTGTALYTGTSPQIVDLTFEKQTISAIPLTALKTAKDIIDTIKDLLNPASVVGNVTASAQSGNRDDVRKTTFAFSGAAGYLDSSSNSQVVIGRNARINGKAIDISAMEKQININLMTGTTKLWKFTVPTVYDESGKYAVGGTAAINTIKSDATVLVAEGSVLNATDGVNIQAKGDDFNLSMILGGGKAETFGLNGLAAVLTGHNNVYVGVDDETKILAGQDVNITGDSDNILAAGVLDVTRAGGVAVGLSAGIMNYDVDNLVLVADNDIQNATSNDDGKTWNITLDENSRKDREASDFTKKLKQVLGDKYVHTGRKSTVLDDGEIQANNLNIDADTSGFRLNIIIAGTETGKQWNNAQQAAGNANNNPAKVQVGVAGSVAINDYDGNTGAILETPKVTLGSGQSDGSLNVNAKDDSFVGAISGAAALSFHSNSEGSAGARIAGAAAVNDIERSVVTEIYNTNISGVTAVDNKAEDSGVQVAAGLSLGVTTGDKDASADGAASVSYNSAKNTIRSVMHNANLTAPVAVVNNIAYDNGLQIAGGVSVEATKAKAGLAAAVTDNRVNNTIEALIQGGTYDVGSLTNIADSKLLQIGTAVSVGVTKATVAVEGAVVVNNITNKVQSKVDGATVTAQKFLAESRDGKLSSEESDNKYIEFLDDANFDVDGTDAFGMANDNLDQNISDNSLTKLENGNGLNNENYFKTDAQGYQTTNVDQDEAITYTAKTYTNDNSGNDMYGVAAVVDVNYKSGDKTGLGAAASVVTNNIDNDFTATVTGSNITVTGTCANDKLQVNASSDSYVLGVAAGMAVSTTKYGGEAVGSYIDQDIDNNTVAKVENSTLKADVLEVLGTNRSDFVAVAGAGGIARGNAAVGFSMVDMDLDNITGAYLLGRNVDVFSSGKGSVVTVKADNAADAVATAASFAISFTLDGYHVPLDGAVALIGGTDDTEAVVDSINGHDSKLQNISNLTVQAIDSKDITAVAGGASAGIGIVAAGGTYAENKIGSGNKHQKTRAVVDNTQITTFNSSAVATVSAADTGDVMTISVGGVGTNGYVAVEGSVADTDIYQDVISGLHNTSVDADKNVKNLALSITANNESDIVTSGDAAVVAAGKLAGVGAGVGVSLLDSHLTTKAEITGTEVQKAVLRTKSAEVTANSTNKLLNVGIGIGVAEGSTAGVSAMANAVDNYMKNDALALVDYADITNEGKLDVQAVSDAKISNYIGALSVGVGATAGVGVSATVGLNEIKDEIRAAVTNSKLNLGNTSDIGLNIKADGTHAMTNLVLGVGVGASFLAGVEAGAVVGLNDIGGSTVAELLDTDVETTGSLTVLADDDMIVKSHVGTLSVGAGTAGVGVGAGVNVDDYSRNTRASVRGDKKKAILNSVQFTVKADSRTDIYQSNSAVGGGFGIAGVGVSASVSDIDMRGTTITEVKNVKSTNSQADIEALHNDKAKILGTGIGLSAGMYGGAGAVNVYNLSNKTDTAALVDGSQFIHSAAASGNDIIKAAADSSVEQIQTNVAVSFSIGGSGAVQVFNNDFEQLVRTVVKDSDVYSSGIAGSKLSVLSENKLRQNLNSLQMADGMVAVGVVVGSNEVNTATLTQTVNSRLRAKSMDVGAKEDLGIDNELVASGGGIGAVDVTVLHNNFGVGLADSYDVEYQNGEGEDGSSTKNVSTEQLQGFVSQGYADQENYINALFDNNSALQLGKAEKSAVLPTETAMYTGANSRVATSKGVAQGLNTLIDNSTLQTTTGELKAYTDKDVAADVEIVGVKIAGIEIGVVSNRFALVEKSALRVSGSNLIADKGNVTLQMSKDGELYNHGTQVGVGAGVIAVNDTYTHREGNSDLQVQSSNLTADKGTIQLTNQDDTKLNNKLTAVDVGGLAVAVMTTKVKDEAAANVILGREAFGVDNTGTTLTGTVQDSSVFKAKSINVKTLVRPELISKVDSTSVALLGGGGSISKINLNDRTLVSVADNVKLDAAQVELNSILTTPNVGNYNVDSSVVALTVSGVAIAVNKSITETDTDAKLLVGNIQLSQLSEQQTQATKLTMNSFDGVSLANEINGDAAGLVTSGTNKVKADMKENSVSIWRLVNGDVLDLGGLNLTAGSSSQENLRANGDGGAFLDISPVAARIDNKDVNNTYAILQGANRSLNISGDLNIETTHSSILDMLCDSSRATLAGGSGTEVINDVRVNTLTDVKDAQLQVGGKTYIDATGKVNLNNVDDHDILKTSGIGGLGDMRSSNVESQVLLGNKVNFTDSTLHGEKSIVLGAYTEGNIHVNDSVQTSGAFGVSESDLKSVVKTDDEVVISGSQIYTDKEGQDIFVVAQDELEGATKGYAEMTASLVGGARSYVTNELERKNVINITGNSKLHSLRDINLYANRDEFGVDGRMEWQLRSELFSGSIIPINLTTEATKLTNTMNQLNQITVDTGAATESIRHTNIYAAAGRESIKKDVGSFQMYGGSSDKADYVSTTAGGVDDYVNRNNYVQVLGNVTAGVTNTLTINIGTSAEAIVVRDEDYKEMVGSANGTKPVYTYAEKEKFISFGNSEEEREAAQLAGLSADDFTVGYLDYSTTLQQRLDELVALQNEYKKNGTGTTSVYMQLDAEINRIQGLINTMGVGGGQGSVNEIDYIELPDLVASGGNIVVDTGDLFGSGNMRAKGSPVVTINNYTNLMLITNKITVEDPGGQFIYNNNLINQAEVADRKAAVAKINVTPDLTIPNIYSAAGTLANIAITNYFDKFNYAGGTFDNFANTEYSDESMKANSYFAKKDANGVVVEYVNGYGNTVAKLSGDKWTDGSGNDVDNNTLAIYNDAAADYYETIAGGTFNPRADIEVNGNITSSQGNVHIENKHHSITIEGKDLNDNVTVSGSIVEIVAPNGSVTQGFTDGIVNIGGDVEQQYKATYDTAKGELKGKNESKSYALLHRSEETDGARAPQESVKGGWIAGGEVYINASDININGNIQSGFPEYVLKLNSDCQTTIDNIKNNWRKAGSAQLTDAQVVNSGATYRIKEGGIVWSSAQGCYIYEMDSFYRPDTDTIVVPSVGANGGRIYLTGRISSTGDGKIMCLDGAYNITVQNVDVPQNGEVAAKTALNYDIQLGDLLVNDTKGQIVMADSGLGRRITYTTDGVLWEEYNASQHKYVKNEQKSSSTGSSTYTYTPESGLTYNWVSGFSTTSYERYKHQEMAEWWGAADYETKVDATLDSWETVEKPFESGDAGDPVDRPEGAYITKNGTSLTEDGGFVVDHSTVADNTKTTHTLEGERRWSTGYLGCHKWVEYTWKDTKGNDQSDGAKVKADNPISIKFVGVQAENAKVEVESAAANKNIILTGNVGNTQLYEVKNQSGEVTGRNEKGTVCISSAGNIVQKNGNLYGATVELKAANNILDVAIVGGNTINLDAVTIGTGEVSTIVKKASGLVGSETSVQLGNYGGCGTNANASRASLTADGNIYQRATGFYDENNVLVQGSRIDLTSKYGQIGTSAKSIAIKAGQQANATDTLSASANVRAYGDIYLTQTTGDLRVGTIWSDNGDLTIQVPNGGIVDALPYAERSGEDEDSLISQWAKLGLIDDGTEATQAAIAVKTQNLLNLRADYQAKIDAETDPDKKAQLEEDLTKIPEQYRVWNKDQLLYAIQDAVINPKAGVVLSSGDKNPNLYGSNITLKVLNNAGLNDPNVQEINLNTLGDRNADGSLVHLNDLKALSQADAATVKWDATNGKATIEKKLAIGLNQRTGGVLTVTNASNAAVADVIYVEGRYFNEDAGIVNPNNNLTAGNLLATKDVRITSLGALFQTSGTQITGKNLLLNVGAADSMEAFNLGSADNYFKANITGNLTALATGNIYVASDGNLVIASASAGKQGVTDSGKIFFNATGNIYGTYVENQGLQGYIRSETDNSISLTARGSIGDWSDVNKTVRILNGTNGELSLLAGDEIVVEGVSTAGVSDQLAPNSNKYLQSAAGVLNIASLDSTTAKKARITVNGGVTFKDNSVDFGLTDGSELDIYGAGLLTVNGNATANTIMLSGATGVQILGGLITGNNVTMKTGSVPTLTYGTVADVNADAIANADVWNSDGQATPTYAGGVKAVNLTVNANRDIDLGGSILVDNATLDTLRKVNFAVQSVSGLNVGNAVTTVAVRNSQDTEGESCVEETVNINFSDAEKTLAINNACALGEVNIYSQGKLENKTGSTIYSDKENVFVWAKSDITNAGTVHVKNALNMADSDVETPVYGLVGTDGKLINTGTIKSDNGYLLLLSGGNIENTGNIDSGAKSVFLLSNQSIVNDDPQKPVADEALGNGQIKEHLDEYQHITAGKHVVMCAVNGLDNKAIIGAGLMETGGDVVLDDFEAFSNEGLLNPDLTKFLTDVLGLGNKLEEVKAYKSTGTIHNEGFVVALKGTVEKGLVHMDSQGMTENAGAIYSVDGEVFLDSSVDLINHKNIYVLNRMTDGTSCDVTLQGTGNVYNTGNIYVKGKGKVLLDADSLDQAKLTADKITDYTTLTPEQLEIYKKVSEIDLIDDTGTTAGTAEIRGIYNTGNIYASDGDVTFKSMYGGDIYNTDELRDKSEAAIVANGSIEMLAPYGSITNTKALKAIKDITIDAMTDIYNLPSGVEGVVASSSLLRGLTTLNGNISLISHGGIIENQGLLVVDETGNVSLVAKGNITNGAIVDINNVGEYVAGTYTGDIHVKTGKVVIQSTGGEVHNINGDIYVSDGSEASAVEITAHGKLVNRGDIFAATGDVTLKSETGSIFNTDELRRDDASVVCSGGSISLLAAQGDVVNTKALVAGKNITIDSLHDIYNLPALDSDEAVILDNNTNYRGKSVERGLTTEDGTITLISHGKVVEGSQLEGLVVNKGSMTANNGNIVITANGSQTTGILPQFQGDDLPLPQDLYEGITYSFLNDKEGNMLATNGNITINAVQSVVTFGDMEAKAGTGEGAANGDISFTSEEGHTVVYSVDDNYKHNRGQDGEHTFTAEGDMKFSAAKGYVYSDKGMHSKGDMFLEFGAGEQTGDIVSENGDVTFISRGVDANYKDLTISNKISAVNGEVTVVSSGNLTINEAAGGGSGIIAKDDIALNAEKNITIENASNITTTEGGLEIQSNSGKVDVAGDLSAQKDVSVDAQEAVTLNGDVTSNTADVVIGSAENKVAVTGNIQAAQDITVDAQKGVNVTGTISATDGDVRLDTAKGAVKIDGKVYTAGNGKGVEILSGGVDGGTSGIIITGTVEADGFVRLYTKGKTDEDRAGKYEDRNPSDYKHNGNGKKQAKLMRAMLLGKAPLAELEEGIYVGGDIITDGDIDIATYGDDVILGNLQAGGMAAVGTHSGQIDVGVMTGNSVTLYSESDAADIKFGGIDVKDKLVLAGNDWNLDMSNVHFDNDGCELYIYGVGDQLQGNITLDFTGCTDMEQLHIRQLNIGRAVIKANAPIIVDNMNVADRVEFYTWGTKTDVYGKMQAYDKEAQVIYYHNGQGGAAIDLSPVFFGYNTDIKQENIDKLSADPSQFEVNSQQPTANSQQTGTGMSLDILSRTVQKSESILLKDARDYSVYGQRYSVESLMQDLLSINVGNVFNTTFNNDIQFFNRFDNVAIPDVVVNQPEEWDKDKFEF